MAAMKLIHKKKQILYNRSRVQFAYERE